ncbi:hypothetical protein M758_4G254700 [Ceratodon purpureus]|nr:hypothetical protein M758_4G254700 [Ceratodon purpureus]
MTTQSPPHNRAKPGQGRAGSSALTAQSVTTSQTHLSSHAIIIIIASKLIFRAPGDQRSLSLPRHRPSCMHAGHLAKLQSRTVHQLGTTSWCCAPVGFQPGEQSGYRVGDSLIRFGSDRLMDLLVPPPEGMGAIPLITIILIAPFSSSHAHRGSCLLWPFRPACYSR